MKERDSKYRLVGIMLTLLAVLGIMSIPTGQTHAADVGASPLSPLQAAPFVGTVSQLQMSPTLPGVSLPSGSNALSSVSLVKDYAGNRFDAYLETNGNDTRIHIIKRNPAGVIVDESVGLPDAGPNGLTRKLNSASISLDGSNIVVDGTAYDLTSPTRTHYPMSTVWAGVAVPYPNGLDPGKGGGATIYTGDGQVPGEPVNYQTIRDIVKEEVHSALGLTGSTDLVTAIAGKPASQGGSIRQGLEDKAKDALREMIDKNNLEQKAQEYQYLLSGFTRDRMYEVLRDNHLLPTPTSTPAPIPTPVPLPSP